MLLFDPTAAASQEPCGVATCARCGRGFYVFPAPQSALQWRYCHGCLTGDCPGEGGDESVVAPKDRLFRLANRRAWG